MRPVWILGPIFVVLLATVGAGGPIGGGSFDIVEQLGSDPWKVTKKFRAGERAAVLVRGKTPAEVKLHIKVFDAKDKLVAEDLGKDPPVAGMAAAFWYPPRDAEYRIEVRNLGASVAECYVTIK